jgi:hypothetical protein
MKPQIKINGKVVQNTDQLPDFLKNLLGDKDNNGIPDVADNAIKMAGTGGILNQILLNVAGKSYSNIADMPPEAKKNLQDKLAKLSKMTGGNIQLQTLFSALMNRQNGAMNISSQHPTVSVSSAPINPVQDDQTASIASKINNKTPENPGLSTTKMSPVNSPLNNPNNHQYFQSGPLNPLGRGMNSLISPAKEKSGGPLFFIAFALIIGWALYELNKNGMLEKILQALK